MKILTLLPPTFALDERPASWTRVEGDKTLVKNGRNTMLFALYWRGHPRAAAIAAHEVREARAKWRRPFINLFRLNLIGEAAECVVERDLYGISLDEALAEGARQLGAYDGAPPGYAVRLDMLEDEIEAAERWTRRNSRLIDKARSLQA